MFIAAMVSLAIHVFFNVSASRAEEPYKKGKNRAIARFFLGTFIGLAGIHAYMTLGTQMALFVCIIFLVFAGANIVSGIRIFKYVRSSLQPSAQSKG
ncbi:hypothetical protein G4V62_08730 [Bacillaceae bacterium SIJ1]|uniref:YtpI family protein n=1 Tax=Litoribacterium kuwaitense TaxID=1398745 RepID=UPI0013EADD7F|nr:YtpI family protein [Litoribacterium kuwaitense]NGP45038.1 hypothetical protein [Litoribacterium kuwaitense]